MVQSTLHSETGRFLSDSERLGQGQGKSDTFKKDCGTQLVLEDSEMVSNI